MPNEAVLGRLKLTKTAVAEADSKLEDRERVFQLNQVDCYPPPGAIAEFVKPADIKPMVLERFLQQEERTRIMLIATEDDKQLPVDKSIGAILGKLDFRSLDISYQATSYLDLLAVTPCFNVKVYVRVRFDVFEVKVTANVDTTVTSPTLGTASFPKGDEIATFRVSEPRQFRFEASFDYNSKCCPVRPDRTPEDKTGPWIPLDFGLPIEWGSDKDWLKPKLKYSFGDK
jgi:hypothetical protein